MNIKTRLALQFTIAVTVFLLGFSVFVYFFWFFTQQSKFRDNLLRRARNTGMMYFSIPEVDQNVLRAIHSRTLSWSNEEIVIADSTGNILYSSRSNYLTKETVMDFQGPSEVQFFKIQEKDGVRFTPGVERRTYSVFVMAYDRARSENLAQLKNILKWSIIIGFLLTISISYLFALRAVLPLSKLVLNLRKINDEKPDSRLADANGKDEIGELAGAVNEMLDRLDTVYRNQKDFVANASHELRTPLAVLITEANYLLSHKHKEEEYVIHISKMINDLKGINELANSLLELSRLIRDSEFTFSAVLVDEILYKVIPGLKIKYPENKIILKIDYPGNDNKLLVSGNSDLLELAIRNIVDNACKFSNEDVLVDIKSDEKNMTIIVTDKGMGIPGPEIMSVLQPFTRASNVRPDTGYGIGLSIVKRIVDLHKGELKIESKDPKGTIVKLILRREE